MASLGNHVGRCTLLFALTITGCITTEDEVEDLGTVGDGKGDTALPRTVTVDLEPGAKKRFRITTAAFAASLTQDGDVDAQLGAKHYELVYDSDVASMPELEVVGDGAVRNWTLTVYNRGDDTLEASVVIAPPRSGGNSDELGIVSDIDKTVLPPETAAGMPAPYPGVATLLTTLELRAGGAAGDVRYVTARTPADVGEIPDWMHMHGVPAGSIDTGVSGVPWVAQAEKVADISRILDGSDAQPFVLFGDTSHRDPEVYKEIRTKYPSRVTAIFIHKVNATVNPTRVEGMYLVNNYAEAAAIAYGLELLTKTEARAVMNAAKNEGLAISAAEIESLLDAQ